MRSFIVLLIIYSANFAAELNFRIIPDTIYVGTLTTIKISVTDLQEDEYPVFQNIAKQPDMYLVVDRILSDNSVDYILQFWEASLISIPSIPVIIKRNKQDILKLQSDIVEITVLSNINENNTIPRFIKPMYKFNFIMTLRIFLYLLLFIIGMFFTIYLLKKRGNSNVHKYYRSEHRKSIFQETIRNLRSLKLPKNINIKATEEYYLKLSHICRTFINEEYFIRATEMTSEELEIYFKSSDVNNELIKIWSQVNKKADIAKYSGKIPEIDQFNKDKENFINIIKSFHRIN